MVLKRRRRNLCGGGGLYKYTISNITTKELGDMVHELLSTEIIPKENITYNSTNKNTFSIIINTNDENYDAQLEIIQNLLKNNFKGKYTYEKAE